jgi:hypothetical protein
MTPLHALAALGLATLAALIVCGVMEIALWTVK